VGGAAEEKTADEREAREEAGEQAYHIGGRIAATGAGRNRKSEVVPTEVVTGRGGVG
jgi:hypothetical protein